jgi:hypothetical protein
VRAQRYAFIIRLWTEASEPGDQTRPVLRGSIQQADSNQTRYFHSLDDLPALLREAIDWQTEHHHSHTEED